MYEFDSVSVSTYEASSLAAKLTEKSADGWEVVAIVPAGSDITAFLKREATGDGATPTTSPAPTPPATEPRRRAGGWRYGARRRASRPGGARADADGDRAPPARAAAAATASTPAAAVGASRRATPPRPPRRPPPRRPRPSVPAGWYADPAGRYELRYWDGSAWTEHVSRAGQQYTDPPVA